MQYCFVVVVVVVGINPVVNSINRFSDYLEKCSEKCR
jgi:hypothetical protein